MAPALEGVRGGAEGVEVAGKAANGEEALRMVGLISPDLITLDLEMPRMDGLTFLRILQQHHPLPVLVISSLTPQGSAKIGRAHV